MNEIDFCPDCGIGLNNSEKRLRFCYNCKHHWEDETIAIPLPDKEDECPKCGRINGRHFAVCDNNQPKEDKPERLFTINETLVLMMDFHIHYSKPWYGPRDFANDAGEFLNDRLKDGNPIE